MHSQSGVHLSSQRFQVRFGHEIPGMRKIQSQVKLHLGGAFGEDHDTIGHDQGFINVMGDEDDCLAEEFMHINDFFPQLQTGEKVESCKRLVHEQYFGVDHQCAAPVPLDAAFHRTIHEDNDVQNLTS